MTTCLMIDDDTAVLEFTRITLAGKGIEPPTFEAVQCNSAEEALAAIEFHRPKFLLLDHHLSGHNGEGFGVARVAISKGILVYSTSTAVECSRELWLAYESLGADYCSKRNVQAMATIITG